MQIKKNIYLQNQLFLKYWYLFELKVYITLLFLVNGDIMQNNKISYVIILTIFL